MSKIVTADAAGLTDNVLVELLDEDGRVVDQQRGSNAVTRAGKEWAINRWFSGGAATGATAALGGFPLETAIVQVNVANVWRNLTIATGANPGRVRPASPGNVVTITGTYMLTANANIPNARMNLARFAAAQRPATEAEVIAFFTLPRVFEGTRGQTIRITWTLRLNYDGTNNYIDDEVGMVRERTGGPDIGQLWDPPTHNPLVAKKLMEILFTGTGAAPRKLTHGRVVMFKQDTAGQPPPLGPINLIQDATQPHLNGTFSVNTVQLTLDFSFSWDGMGVAGSGPFRRRWFYMGAGASAGSRESLRWQAGTFDIFDNIPTTSTDFTTGFRVA